MSRITLSGWLRSELARMAGQDTTSLHKLAVLAREYNSRLYEPLLVYAIENGTATRLLSYIDDEDRRKEFQAILDLCGGRSILALSETETQELPWSYRKLIHTWKSVEGRNARIESSKKLRLDRIRKLMKAKNVTNAQIYHALDLNPGNTNVYLKYGDVSKLSLDNTTRIMKYLYTL